MQQSLPISVVIPVYNRASLLHASLASVAAQESPPSEIIVVDDGSSEDIAGIASEFGARVIRQDNAGVSAARNAGIMAAEFPWIAFLDSDDLWQPEKLRIQWSAVRASSRIGFVFCDLRWFGEGDTPNQNGLADDANYLALHKTPIAPDVAMLDNTELIRAVCGSNIVQASGILVRTELARMVMFDVGLRYCEDHDFTLRAIARTVVAVVMKPMVGYRYHNDSLSNDECELALGALLLSQRVRSQPYRYADPIPEEYRARMWYLHRRAGAALLRAKKMRSARRHLIASIKRRPTAIAFAGLLATFAPWAVGLRPRRARPAGDRSAGLLPAIAAPDAARHE